MRKKERKILKLIVAGCLILSPSVYAKGKAHSKIKRTPSAPPDQEYKCKISVVVTYDDGLVKTEEYLDPAKTIDDCRKASKVYTFPKPTHVVDQKVVIEWSGAE